MNIKESSVDEIEPCLRGTANKSPDSVLSQFSSVSRRKPDYARRCILALLIHAVFIMAVFLAFFIGHWISEQNERNSTVTEELFFILTPSPPINPPAKALVIEDVPTLLTTPARKNSVTRNPGSLTTPKIIERLIPLPSRTNFTMEYVHPPSFESYEFLEELHSAHRGHGRTDSLLVPLPLHILPIHYDILLDLTRFSDEKFIRGNLTVHLESYGNSTDDEILFHVGPKVNIERIRLRREGKRLYPKTIKREDSKKLARLILRERLQRGRYLLDIEYNTTICAEDGGVHCYLENRGSNSSQRVSSFTTKFEPALARSFLPCWDEPGIKATFNISVLHQSRFIVLSNMPPDSGRPRRDLRGKRTVITQFQETPPMSSYLLAFAVGEFVRLEMRTERNLPMTVWTHPEDFLSAHFAANFSPVMFDRHEEELEVPYPLPKMDFVAARSFPVGGMENWGLVIFDKQSLLLDHSLEDNVNMTVDRLFHEYRIEKIITHELSHQWFGNLVTMRDWSDLWLNEGFASYYVYHLLQEEHPRLTENEYYTRLGHLVRKQSSHDCPALVRPLLTEIEVEQSFHTTHLYTKGCVMVRMIRDLVSDFDFRSGVRRYLRKNAYRSVSRDELWASLPAYADHGAEHERLSEVMEGWLVNEGVPEVTIIRNYDNDMIRVTQRQSKNHRHRVFLHSNQNNESRMRVRRRTQDTQPFDDELFNDLPLEYVQRMKKKKHSTRVKKKQRPPTVKPSPDILIEARREELRKTRRVRDPSDVWSIPFSYMFGSLKSSEGQVVRQFWLKNRSLSFADVELAPSQPLLANPDWAYPYRVNYDMKNWKMIARLLHQSHLEIPTKSRMQLIIDAETFLSQSNLPHLYIYILGYLAHESDLGVALVGMDAIHRLVDAFQGSTINNSLRLYLSPVIAQIDKLMDESQADTELSALWLIEPTRLSKLYQLRCAANIASCDQDAQTKRWLEFPSSYLEDVHKQVTAVCHFLFTNNSEKETHMLESQLKSRGSQWSTAVQLAACTRSDRLVKLAAKQIVATKNAAIFASSLQSDFSLHYNPKFRSALWTQIGKMPLDEKRLLFSVNESDPQPASKILLHSVKSIDELRQVRSLVPDWGPRMSKHFEYIEQQLQWQDKVTRGVLTDFFSNDDTI